MRIISLGAVVAGSWVAGNRLTDGGSPTELTGNTIDPAASLPVPPSSATPTAPNVPDTTAPVIIPATEPSIVTVPLETQPAITVPPATRPPATQPPVTIPLETVPPPTDPPAADTITCRNDRYDYSIDYPASWYMSDGDDEWLRCTWFDPMPYDPADEFEIDVAISAYYVNETLDQMAEWELDPLLVTVLESGEFELDGRRTIVALVEFTGGAYWPAGWIGYFYLIDWDGQTFELFAAGTPDDFPYYIEVLDGMAGSLRLGVPPT